MDNELQLFQLGTKAENLKQQQQQRNKTQTAVINIINLRIFALLYNVYHRCLCFISDEATMAQEQKSL